MNKSLWPIVTITAVVIAALTVILAVTPAADVATRSSALALLATIVPSVIGVWVKSSIDDVKKDVTEAKESIRTVQEQTNGHMTQLISAKTTPEGNENAVHSS